MSVFYVYKKEFLNKKVDQQALKKVERVFKKDLNNLKKGFNNCFYTNYKQVERALKNMFYKVLEEIKTNNDLIKAFQFKSDNKKIGGAFIYNISNYLLCKNMHTGQCNLCKICFASQQELVTSKKDPNLYVSLYKWFKNYIFFTYLKYVNYSKLLLYYVALKIRDSYNNKINKPVFIRLNEKSDIRDQQDLNNISFLSDLLYSFIGLNTYSYTKTNKLDWSNISNHLRVNKSKGLYNSFETVDPIGSYYTSETVQQTVYLLSHGCINCYGSCFECGFKCGNLKSPSRVCNLHGSKIINLNIIGGLY